jgi:hypothetical protein
MDVSLEHLMEVTGRLHAYATLRCRKGALVPIGWEDGWASDPVLDALEGSGPSAPVLDAMEAIGLQVRSKTPLRRVGSRSGLRRH